MFGTVQLGAMPAPCKELKEIPDYKAFKVPWDPLVHLEQLDPQALRVSKALKAILALKVPLDQRAILVLKAFKEKLALKALLDPQARKD